MKPADFRRIALSLEGAEEGSHMGAADFRVGGRIFATLASQKEGYGVVLHNGNRVPHFSRLVTRSTAAKLNYQWVVFGVKKQVRRGSIIPRKDFAVCLPPVPLQHEERYLPSNLQPRKNDKTSRPAQTQLLQARAPECQ